MLLPFFYEKKVLRHQNRIILIVQHRNISSSFYTGYLLRVVFALITKLVILTALSHSLSLLHTER